MVKMMLAITIVYCKATRIDVTSKHSDMEQLSEFLNDVISCLDIQMISHSFTEKYGNAEGCLCSSCVSMTPVENDSVSPYKAECCTKHHSLGCY
jgi:hypothetical protein